MVGCDGNHVDPIDAIDDEEIVRLVGAGRNLLVRAHGKDAKIAQRGSAKVRPGLDHKRLCRKLCRHFFVEPSCLDFRQSLRQSLGYKPRSFAAQPSFISESKWASDSS